MMLKSKSKHIRKCS